MYWLYFLVSLLATCAGGICGIGGGVVIKPLLDAIGTMSVSAVSFLSGCTVLSMSIISVLKNRKQKGTLDLRISTPLAIGSVFGGILGKSLFDVFKVLFHNENRVGAIQAGLLILVTLGSLLYSTNSKKISTHSVNSLLVCGIIGLSLGMVSSFLGIGGGPINLTVLFFFFSMDTKKAVANSLYIIMFSQFSSLLQSLIQGSIPSVDIWILLLMILAGFLGGLLGGRINKRITADKVDRLFIGFMVFIIGINIYNLCKFTLF